MSQVLTGKPSVDKPWMQYYPEQLIKNLKVPSSTIGEYLAAACPGKDVTAIHYYIMVRILHGHRLKQKLIE